MKTIFKIAQLVLFLLIGSSVFAQRISYMEITEKRIEYIAPRLNLTSTESEKFWPIFREFYEQRELIARKSKLRNKQTDEKSPQTEEEYINAINFMIDNKIDQTTLMKEYMKKYLEVLPAGKVYRLYQLDEEFNKFLLEQLKGQGQGKRK